MVTITSKIFNIFLFLALIFTSGHAFQTIYERLSYIVYFGAIIFVGICFINIRKKINAKNLFLLMSFVIPPLFTMILDGSNVYYYLIIVSGILFAYGITTTIPFYRVVDIYLKLMTVVSAIALIGYILYNYTDFLDFLPRLYNSNGKEYAIGFVFNVLTRDSDRNCGMFWEPGLFATALSIAMVFEILFKQKISKLRIILFVLCFVTANSSAGFVLCFLCLSLPLLKNIDLKKNSLIKNIFYIIILFAFVFALFNADTIIMNTPLKDNEYFAKLLSDNVKESTRYLAIWHNLTIFSKHPLFGAGVNYVNQNMLYVADTSTVTYMMSVFGLLGIWYAFNWCVGIMKIKKINILTKLVLILVIMIILNKEPHLRLTFSWCLLFYLNIETYNNNSKIKSGIIYNFSESQ